MQFLWIGVGGFLGANMRYRLQQSAARLWGVDFPYGTMIANVLGSFLIALYLTLATGKLAMLPEARLFVAVGLLGDFTTFSSFSYETLQLVTQDRLWAAGLNLLGDVGLGLLGVFLGIALGRWLQGTGGG
jgi:CrcB protein